jgi:hypothetical protein
MLKQMSLAAIALAALPALAEAQQSTSARAMVTQGAPQIAQAPPASSPARAGGTMTDEYGNMYNSRGERIDRSGRVIAPPVTPPGARALR